MIGYNLITHQTVKDGLPVKSVLIHEGVDILKEFYVAFVLDRTTQRPAIIVSKYGGVEIEEVPHEHIHVFPIEPKTGLTQEIAQKVTDILEL